MIEGLENLLEGSSQPGLTELRTALQELSGGPEVRGRLIEQHPLKPRVYRLRLEIDDHIRSLVIKRHDPDIAWRNRLVAERWMPAIGLGQSGPALLGAAAERSGCCVWHLYEDLGDWALDNHHPDPERVKVAVELVAQIHGRFAGHALLGECRLWGGDLGIHFYAANVRDAIHGLEALRSPAVTLSPEHAALRNRLPIRRTSSARPDRVRIVWRTRARHSAGSTCCLPCSRESAPLAPTRNWTSSAA